MIMVEEEKSEKKVAVKEKPLSGTKVVEETETQRAAEQPSDASGRVENMASKSGAAIGTGLKKVGKVIEEFTAGVSKEMKPSEKGEKVQEARKTEYRSEQRERTEDAPQAKVTEKEKVEKKVTKEKE
jgi:hypothetical protein